VFRSFQTLGNAAGVTKPDREVGLFFRDDNPCNGATYVGEIAHSVSRCRSVK
jgi:hypothetical protein